MAPSEKQSVFISYVGENGEFKRRIKQKLQSAGISVWDNPQAWNHAASKTELERAREHCQVCVLIVSQSYLNSDIVRKSELPFILADATLRIIYVIAERCSWQSSLPPQPFAVIPPDGGSLLTSNEETVLSLIVREVRRAIQDAEYEEKIRKGILNISDVTTTGKTESSVSTPVRSQTVQTPLAKLLAVKLNIDMPSGGYEAMATLISPSVAVTTYQAIYEALPRSDFFQDRSRTITIQHSSSPRSPILVTLTAIDEKADFAVLRLDVPVQFVVPFDLIRKQPLPRKGIGCGLW